jgi:hypothetical protein
MTTTQDNSYPKSVAASGVRPCERRDIRRVTEIFCQVFRDGDPSLVDDLPSYFEQVYFDNPWVDHELPSLIYEQQGVVTGFLGVVPRSMQLDGNHVRVAVCSGLTVQVDDSGTRNPIAAVQLMRRFLGGKQDLSLTDTANEVSRGLWTACGGDIAFPYSYSWTRPLQPLNTLLQMGVDSPLARGLAQPVCRLADALLGNLPPIKPAASVDCIVETIDTATLLENLNSLPAKSLTPIYDLASLDWLVSMAEQSESEGKLVKRSVTSRDGRQLGWFVYYQNKYGFGRVLQLVAHPRCMDRVLDSLLFDAKQAGVAALWGRTDPQHAGLFTERHCVFHGRPWVLIHSDQNEIIRSFQNAEAFFTGFEGELWMKTNA